MYNIIKITVHTLML